MDQTKYGCKKTNNPVITIGSNIRCNWVISFPLRRKSPANDFEFASFDKRKSRMINHPFFAKIFSASLWPWFARFLVSSILFTDLFFAVMNCFLD